MRAFSGDVQARWQARRDRTDADAVHRPRARTDVPNQQFLASTVRAVDGHNRRLAERSRGSDGATGVSRDGDAEERRSDMLDERLDWAARKAAAAAAAAEEEDDDDGSDASDDAAAARARKKAQKKKLKKEAKKLAKKILLKKKKKKAKARRQRAEAEAAEGDDAIRAVMGFGGFTSTSGGSVDNNRTGAGRGGARAREAASPS
jgi:hypothetical protein